jgi:uncharacterized transporter YbjL
VIWEYPESQPLGGLVILAGAMTVDAAVTGSCEVAESQTPVLGVAVPYAIANVFLTVLGPIIVGLTFVGKRLLTAALNCG